MKKSSFLFILLLMSVVAIAQPVNKETLAVQQTIENMFATLTNTDTAALKTYVITNVHFYEYGQVWTIDSLIQKVIQSSSSPGFKRTNSFEFVSTSINKKTAWVTYYLQSVFTRNGKEETIKWMETVVLLKEKNNWKITVLHSTRIPKN
jgi:SnoaL-like domain